MFRFQPFLYLQNEPNFLILYEYFIYLCISISLIFA